MAKTVLIVEDNELNMKLFRDLLEAHGYQTSGTSNGFEALDLVRHVRVGDLGLGAELLAQHADPAELHADLVYERAQRDALAGEQGAHRAGRHVVALLDAGDGARDLLVGDDDLAPLHLLQFQPLVDVLNEQLTKGTVRARRGTVAKLLKERRPNIYSESGYSAFTKFAEAAEAAGLVRLGGTGRMGDGAWIELV